MGVINAEILRDEIIIGADLLRAADKGAAAGVQDHGLVGHLQRKMPVLFDQDDGQSLVLQAMDGATDFGDDQRRQALRWLVEQQDAGIAHQRPADRQHLLFATRKGAGQLGLPFPQPREHLVYSRHGPELVAAALALPGDIEVLVHRQRGEHPPSLRHEANAGFGDSLRRETADRPAEQADVAVARLQETHDGRDAGGLAGAVAAEEAQQAARPERERDAMQHMAVAVERIHLG